ncbi:MAG: glycosyltransferase family 4 protein, partial [Bryobacteraceae bacterium]
MGTLAFLGISSLLFALTLTPLVRNASLHFGLVDVADNRRKLHGGSIPRVGGIAILLAYVASFVFALMVPLSGDGMIAAAIPKLTGVFLAVLIIFATGLIDDLATLSPRQKLLGELLGAIVACCFGVQVHVMHGSPLGQWTSPLVTIVWLLACTNAFNLIDGLDGLASGVGLFATATILIAAITDHNIGLAIVT